MQPSESCAYSRLLFKGVNYKANLFVNGEQIATTADFVGTFRYFYFDTSRLLWATRKNAVVLEVFRPHNRALPSTNKDTDLAMSFVDWAPSPPDSNMVFPLCSHIFFQIPKGSLG